jgi:hypothetical protein
MRKRILQGVLISGACLLFNSSIAQTNKEFTGWGGWFHTQRFSQHWGANFDAQFRSADHLKYLRNILIRPSVSYYFDNAHFATVGYLYTYTHNETAAGNTTRPEHRIWEQFILNKKLGRNVSLQNRFRLEQRFVNSLGAQEKYFAQRLRYFVRAVIPIGNKDSTFKRGPFLGLQNELFFNVQNKSKVNGDLFDQNRGYVSLGYRLKKEVDVEVGYLNQYVNARGPVNTLNNVLQVALYTRFGK